MTDRRAPHPLPEIFDPLERDLLVRMRPDRVIGVTGPDRREALNRLAFLGVATVWEGEGVDRGLLMGRLRYDPETKHPGIPPESPGGTHPRKPDPSAA